MRKIINRKLYNTETAQLVATDRYWDGSNWDRNGRSETLYKTLKGNFFIHRETRWDGERQNLVAIPSGIAQDVYCELPVHLMEWEEAFGVAPEEA